MVSFPKIFQTVSEGVGTHNVKLMLNPAPTSDITVPYIVVTHRATWGSDFTIANGGTVSVRAGATTATIPVTIFDDTEAEPNEHFEVRLRKGTDYRLGPAALYMLVIARSDPTVVSLARTGPGAVLEGGKTAFTVTLGRSLAAGEVIDAPLSVSGTGVTTADWTLAKESGAAKA